MHKTEIVAKPAALLACEVSFEELATSASDASCWTMDSAVTRTEGVDCIDE
jgi:hypothetical protein